LEVLVLVVHKYREFVKQVEQEPQVKGMQGGLDLQMVTLVGEEVELEVLEAPAYLVNMAVVEEPD
jgi:hypothetical protein